MNLIFDFDISLLMSERGTPATDLGHMNVVLKQYCFFVLFYDPCFEIDIRIRRYTNRRWIEQKKNELEDWFWIVIDVMFDLEISLFTLNVDYY